MNVGEHVKNYRPQILVLCGRPQHRPSLLDFANLLTKNHSLLIVGDIIEERIGHKLRSQRITDANEFLKSNKIKAFYTAIENTSFEKGAKAMLQTAGIGKLTPNVLLMGYKNDWTVCNCEELLAYFNVLHAAFDHHRAVTILRVKGGLDYSILTEIDESNSSEQSTTSTRVGSFHARTSPASALVLHSDSNLSLADLAVSVIDKDHKEGDNKETDNNQKNTKDPEKSIDTTTNLSKKEKKKKSASAKLDVVLNMTNEELMHVEDINKFRRKQGKGFIDVWWLYDDGGLTMLLPYIVSTRHDWSSCKLRVFGLASNKTDLALEERNMAHLLSKFRLNYASLKMVSISDKPKPETILMFDDIIETFRNKSDGHEDCQISEAELGAYQEKTHRQLRLRELLEENSRDANLVVMSLPMPRKGKISAPLYMAWLEILTKDMPPFLLVRGNQQSVLTFYS